MHPRVSIRQLLHMRLCNQRLTAEAAGRDIADVIHDLCALQSQEWPSAQLAIHARSDGITQGDVKRTREIERSFVLTWTLRGTLHLVAAEDLRWLIALCGSGAVRATRRRYQQLDLSKSVREAALEAIQPILSREGALIRSELATALATHGIPVEGQAIHHLVRYAALHGLICLGAARGRDLTYVLLDDWLPDGLPMQAPDDPARELALRYLSAYAPATAADFARWSGLSQAQVKAAWAAIAEDCVIVTIPGGEALVLNAQIDQLSTTPAEPTVRLLPRYDNYLLGYASRDFMVDEAFVKQVHPGGGLIRACVVVDGEARASWKLEKRRTGVRVCVSPYETLNPAALEQLGAETQSLGRFLETTAELKIEGG